MVKPPPRLVQPYVPELVLSLSLSAPRQEDNVRSSSTSASASAGRGPAGRATTSHQELVRRTHRRDDDDHENDDEDEDTGPVGTNDAGTEGPRRQRLRQRGLRELRPIVLETSASASASASSAALAASPNVEDEGSTVTSRNVEANDTEKSTSSSPSSPVLSSSNPTGWAKVTMGSTLVLCHVHAPVPVANLASNHQYYDGSIGGDNDDGIMDDGILACHVHLAPHLLTNLSSSGGGSLASSARHYERSLERQLHQALLPSVPLRQYAKCAILLQITVVSSADIMGDLGGDSPSMSSSSASRLLGPSVVAATLALADAGVELYDVVTCGRVALVGFNKDDQTSSNNNTDHVEVVVDPDPHEERRARGVLTVAIMNSWREVTYWNQQASASMDVDPQLVNEAVDCCLEVCKTLHKLVVRHLQQRGPVLPPAGSNRT